MQFTHLIHEDLKLVESKMEGGFKLQDAQAHFRQLVKLTRRSGFSRMLIDFTKARIADEHSVAMKRFSQRFERYGLAPDDRIAVMARADLERHAMILRSVREQAIELCYFGDRQTAVDWLSQGQLR